ncbi:uncharacterized protein BROUX77_000208 [Berkeleyomyces rouxiae]|uniref:uncharacterized protein n=1 Tax=Berkeleyomyces rouxiae TaxID=2035830 RepID=UPI003B79FE4C
MERSRGIPDEELFLSRPNNNHTPDGDSPTIEPLRIQKPQSPKPAGQDRFKYPTPPASVSTPPAPFSTSKPAFPLPPGALSSANIISLPYPDDDEPTSTRVQPTLQTSVSPVSYNQNDTSPRFGGSSEYRGPGLAQRRGTAPKPLSGPSSPSLPTDELHIKPLAAPNKLPSQSQVTATSSAGYPHLNKHSCYPEPTSTNSGASSSAAAISILHHPEFLDHPGDPSGVNRFASTASTSTTRASRGSPPPPETPILEPGAVPGGGIEARYGVGGLGTSTASVQSAAASQRFAQYGAPPQQQQQQQSSIIRPWTPTETPGAGPHGPPTVYQGSTPVANSSQTPTAAPNKPLAVSKESSNLQVSVLEQDFQRLGTKTPPPAYSSLNAGSGSKYPKEKQQRPNHSNAAGSSSAAATVQPAATSAAGSHGQSSIVAPQPISTTQTAAQPELQISTQVNGSQPQSQQAQSSTAQHPALQQPQNQQEQQESQSQPQTKAQLAAAAAAAAVASAGLSNHPAFANDAQGNTGTLPLVSSPPPLPEGWIAHLDQNSGQYYYIHLSTQSTQWEFPKGPNPISHDTAPLSPTASTYGNPLASPLLTGKHSMASPMFPPQTPGYAESIISVAHSTAPSTAGFSGPPPSSGVDLYKVQPTNGVYFGPYLRYVNMDIEKGVWHGSIMIVTDSPQPPTIHVHLSMDLSPNPRQLIPQVIAQHQRWKFHKYEVTLPMGESGTERWTYAVTSHMGCTRYEFVVAGKTQVNWRFIAHSGNDFSPTTSQNERSKLGGVGFMWKDVLQRNIDCGGYHVQLGLGSQIYGDRLWKEIPSLKQWLSISGKDNRKNAQWTASHEEDVSHAYFHYYTSHFDQPYLREAFAQIPHVLQLDDHDIFDGYGSYPDYMHNSSIFQNIGRVAYDMYLLFQHHTSLEILRNVSNDFDLFSITSHGWHFIKYLGPSMAVVGMDCRSERTIARVMAGPTYQGLFPKIASLPPSVQHCVLMIPVPLVYPRLEAVESLAGAVATGKKAVNTTYNILGKVTSSVAGVVGGKEVVAHGFSHVKKAVGKQGFMGSVLNQFGDLDMAEMLKDLWTHESKDLERTYLIRTLQGIAQQKGLRMTFLSGDVNCAGAGLVHNPSRPRDHKTMYQIITSPIVAQPQGQYTLKMLHNSKVLYVPQNGHKSTNEVSDTKEDMMEIFHTDASGTQRELKRLMGRRNYISVTSMDSEYVDHIQQQQQVQMQMGFLQPPITGPESKLTLQIDFVVQGDGAFTTPTKYGPVYLPHLELGC